MIGLLAPLIGGAVKTMCMSMLSEKLLQQVILILLEKLVKSTKTRLMIRFCKHIKILLISNSTKKVLFILGEHLENNFSGDSYVNYA